uniref:Transmembrane protein 221 n=1 Tax=Pelusios castaneus TaxID=367368 RepID=A0A8C8RUX6_9SAUR
MPSAHAQRSRAALLLFGGPAAIVALLASGLVFQLQAAQARGDYPGFPTALQGRPSQVLLAVGSALAVLGLVLSVGCLLLCLLHGYASAQVCGGHSEPDRIDWFLLDSRVIRHIAIGLFSCGLSIYLAAFAIYTLLLFRYETGITNACILSSAIIVLVMMVLYAIVRAPRVLRRHQFEL